MEISKISYKIISIVLTYQKQITDGGEMLIYHTTGKKYIFRGDSA